MSNTPFFDALLAEYDEKKQKELLSTLSTPIMTSVKKPQLPKRNLAQIIKLPEPDPEFARKMQEFIQTAPMQILEGTPAGSFIKSMDVVKDDDTGELLLEAEVMVPPVQTVKKDVADTVALFNGMRPNLAWVDEWQSSNPDEDEIYIAPSGPLVVKEDRDVYADYKQQVLAERVVERQLDAYRSASPFARLKGGQALYERSARPMTEETMPSWIAAEVQESNEKLSDPEPVEERTNISFKGYTPEQTDESVNAASKHVDHPTAVKPLWVTNEE